METIRLQEQINKFCYETGTPEKQVRIKLKTAMFPDSSAANKDQYLHAILSGKRKSLRPREYNVICSVLNCTSDDLNGTHLNK